VTKLCHIKCNHEQGDFFDSHCILGVKLADGNVENVAKQQQEVIDYRTQKDGNGRYWHFLCRSHLSGCLQLLEISWNFIGPFV